MAISDDTRETFDKICDKAEGSLEDKFNDLTFTYDTGTSSTSEKIVDAIDDSDKINDVIPSLVPYALCFVLAVATIFIWIGYCCLICCCGCCVPEKECCKTCCFFMALICWGIVFIFGIVSLSLST